MTEEELFSLLDEEHHDTVRKWLDRGDGVAVYQNIALDHSRMGQRKFVSYGSEKCQLEPCHCDEAGCPPNRLPDIGGQINWPYRLEGVCRR